MITESLESGIEIGNKSVDLIDGLIDKVEKYRRIKQDTTSYLRLLYLETVNNLEVLNSIDIDQFSYINVNDKRTNRLLHLLQIEVAESVFYKYGETANTELYDRLRKKGKLVKEEGGISNLLKSKQAKKKEYYIYENILQALSFIVTKTTLLRKISVLDDEELEIVRKINLKTRIQNIHQRMQMIKKLMDKMEETKEMAR